MTTADPYDRALLGALLWQVLFFGFAVCGMPQEMFMRACLIVSVGFWVGVIIVRVRRPIPTPGDLYYVRRGLAYIGALGMIAALTYWTFAGALG